MGTLEKYSWFSPQLPLAIRRAACEKRIELSHPAYRRPIRHQVRDSFPLTPLDMLPRNFPSVERKLPRIRDTQMARACAPFHGPKEVPSHEIRVWAHLPRLSPQYGPWAPRGETKLRAKGSTQKWATPRDLHFQGYLLVTAATNAPAGPMIWLDSSVSIRLSVYIMTHFLSLTTTLPKSNREDSRQWKSR